MSGHIANEGTSSLRLRVDGRLLDEQEPGALRRVYNVKCGSETMGNDAGFFLLQFPDKLWVVPETTSGIVHLVYSTLREYLAKERLFYDAHLSELPRAWAKPVLWGLLRSTEPRLMVSPIRDIPHWELLQGPFDPQDPYRVTILPTTTVQISEGTG